MTSKSRTLRFVALLCAGTVLAGPAAADELAAIKARMNPMCSDEAKTIVAENVRQTIEDSVTRGEAAIKPPIPLGDLACLEGLMKAPLDIFSGIGAIGGSLAGDLAGQIGNIPDSISSKICAFAAEKWGNLTEPVNVGLNQAGNMTFNVEDIWSNLNNASSGSGNGSTGSVVQNPDPIGQYGDSNADQDEPLEQTYTMEEIRQMIANGQIQGAQPASTGDTDGYGQVGGQGRSSLNSILLGGGN